MASSAQAADRSTRFHRVVEQYEVLVQRALVAALGPEEGRAATVGAFAWAYPNVDALEQSPRPAARLYEAGLHSVARGAREFHADQLSGSPAMRETLSSLDRDRRVALLLSLGHRYDDASVADVLDIDRDQLRVLLLGANDAVRRGLHHPVGGDAIDPQVAAVARELDRLTQPIDPDQSVVRGATDEASAADQRAFMLVIVTALVVVVLGVLWVIFNEDDNARIELAPRTNTTGQGQQEDPFDTDKIEIPVRDLALPSMGIGVVIGSDVVLYGLDGDLVGRANEADDASEPAPGSIARVSAAGGLAVVTFTESPARAADRLADDCALPDIGDSGTRASVCGPPDALDRIDLQRVAGGPVTTLISLPPTTGDAADGEWISAIVSPNGESVLAQWADPCPTAFLLSTVGGALATATGEGSGSWPAGQASTWIGFTANGNPVVQLDPEPACGTQTNPPGLYRIVNGDLELITETPDAPVFAFVWERS